VNSFEIMNVLAFRIFLTFTSIIIINAELPKFSDPSELDPEQIGIYHTDAFLRLTEKYASKEPKDMKAVDFDMFKIVSSYCVDHTCIRNVYQSALEQVPLGAQSVEEVLPDGIDESVRVYLKSFESAIYEVNTDNAEDIIDEMEAIQAKLREDDTLDEKGKYLGLAAGSIAIESTKLWTNVFRDPSHPLNVVRKASKRSNSMFQRRRLQSIVITTGGGQDSDLRFTIFADFATLIAFFGIPFPAIFASLWALAVSRDQEESPSLQPSISPSRKPSAKPSLGPSIQPTISSIPSILPTSAPSLVPTISNVPSVLPSVVPSKTPSLMPSLKPSLMPSLMPSRMPSLKPSLMPSRMPSLKPSSVPSLVPTISHAPSLFSSQNPSTNPSINPSQGPTR